jgi:hypothetical protein
MVAIVVVVKKTVVMVAVVRVRVERRSRVYSGAVNCRGGRSTAGS